MIAVANQQINLQIPADALVGAATMTVGTSTSCLVVHEVVRSPGHPHDSATCAFMEPRFGYNFSRIGLHTDRRAAEPAMTVNALAHTVGKMWCSVVGNMLQVRRKGGRCWLMS